MRAPFRTRTTLPSSINGMTEWSSSSILTWVLQRSAAELLTLMLVAAAATLSTHPLFPVLLGFCSSATSLLDVARVLLTHSRLHAWLMGSF